MSFNIGNISKAIVAFVIPGLVALGAALIDTSDGGSGVTAPEWIGIALACLATSGVVWAVPNAKKSDPPVVDPDGELPVI